MLFPVRPDLPFSPPPRIASPFLLQLAHHHILLVQLALTIPRLALPSTPYIHTQPHLVPSTTLDLLINVTLLGWKPTSFYSPRTRKGPCRSPYEHLLVGLRDLGFIGLMLGAFVGLFPLWEGYERGEKEVFVEVSLGVAAAVSRSRVPLR